MSINVNEDVIGSGGLGSHGWGGGSCTGIYIFAIIIVFFVAVAGFWGRRDHDGGHGFGHPGFGGCGGWGESCADKMTWSRYANYEDPAIAKVQTEIACTTGQIKTQNAIDTGQIIHVLDRQTCDIQLGEAKIIQNQLNIAREQEVMALNTKICDLREEKLELKGKLLQQETVNTINAGNCQINNRLGMIESQMVKHPPFYAAGGSPYINPFNFQPAPVPVAPSPFRDNNCCCG